jgi:hypothetical protein
MCFFPCLNLITVLDEEIDIVQTILQTMLLITIDFEMLTVTSGQIRDRLVRQIHTHLRLVVFVDAVEELFQESSDTTTGSTKLLSSLFLWISAKKELMTTRKP